MVIDARDKFLARTALTVKTVGKKDTPVEKLARLAHLSIKDRFTVMGKTRGK